MSHSGQIGLANFGAGHAIEVTYITPDNGRPTLNLQDDAGNIVLHVNPRWDQHSFVLNTKKGNWGPEERPGGFDFSTGVPLTLRVEATDDALVIYINGQIIHRYKHRMPVNSIKKAHFQGPGGGKKPVRLICLSQYF